MTVRKTIVASVPGLELTADVAAGVDAVAKGQDVDRDEGGHEGEEREHVDMIGRKRGRT